jgi:hypothetical protein
MIACKSCNKESKVMLRGVPYCKEHEPIRAECCCGITFFNYRPGDLAPPHGDHRLGHICGGTGLPMYFCDDNEYEKEISK